MIHICFNLDEKYLMPCKVLIREIDNKTSDEITYHFIGISQKDMGTKNKCKFYPNPDLSYFKDENLGDYYYFSQAAMYRLLIPFMIKADRAIYMDIDMIVLEDMKNLWNKEVDLAGAVIDPHNLLHKNRLKLKTEYYNSGLILFNSKKIRKEFPDYKERILKAQKDYILDLKDQDIFNVVFNERITTLDYEWNIDANNLIEKEETKETTNLKERAFNNPSIVHCMGSDKWWNYEGLPFGKVWDSYAKELIPKQRRFAYKLGKLLIIRN